MQIGFCLFHFIFSRWSQWNPLVAAHIAFIIQMSNNNNYLAKCLLFMLDVWIFGRSILQKHQLPLNISIYCMYVCLKMQQRKDRSSVIPHIKQIILLLFPFILWVLDSNFILLLDNILLSKRLQSSSSTVNIDEISFCTDFLIAARRILNLLLINKSAEKWDDFSHQLWIVNEKYSTGSQMRIIIMHIKDDEIY